MASRSLFLTLPGALTALVLLALPAAAQNASSSGDSASARELGSWLGSSLPDQTPAETYKATTGTVTPDPFAVLTSGALWEQTYGELYTRDLGNSLALSCQESSVLYDVNDEELSRAEQMGFTFAPMPELALSGNLHGTSTDSDIPENGTQATGAGLSAQSHLPNNSVVAIGLKFDRNVSDLPDALATQTNTYNAEIDQPLGKLPLSAQLKGQFQDTTAGNSPAGSLPSLEQSLVWKPLTNTTLQMGLRQQQYQEYPGIDHELNEAVFADLSQQMTDGISWHSYAELLNTKGLYTDAPGTSIASGANGTPQATMPGSNAGLTSSMPLSLEDQTLTFSTGPTVQLQKDISASLEYSNRWDKNPAPGSTGNEQRVSVSVKGTF
jgi:hypothetical protein